MAVQGLSTFYGGHGQHLNACAVCGAGFGRLSYTHAPGQPVAQGSDLGDSGRWTAVLLEKADMAFEPKPHDEKGSLACDVQAKGNIIATSETGPTTEDCSK